MDTGYEVGDTVTLDAAPTRWQRLRLSLALWLVGSFATIELSRRTYTVTEVTTGGHTRIEVQL